MHTHVHTLAPSQPFPRTIRVPAHRPRLESFPLSPHPTRVHTCCLHPAAEGCGMPTMGQSPPRCWQRCSAHPGGAAGCTQPPDACVEFCHTRQCTGCAAACVEGEDIVGGVGGCGMKPHSAMHREWRACVCSKTWGLGEGWERHAHAQGEEGVWEVWDTPPD
eukprot:347605-Chlamydomonas_euryale.AAC.1